MNLLRDMQLFVKVAQCNSLTAAGKELNLTTSCISIRLKKLELFYNVKLLNITTRSIDLTCDGHLFFKDCVTVTDKMINIENKLKSMSKDIDGTVRISAPADLGRQHIAPIIRDFVKHNPTVDIYLELSDSITDLDRNSIDIAIRYGVNLDSDFIARKITESHLFLCASPAYLEANRAPNNIFELEGHTCLTIRQNEVQLIKWYFDKAGQETSITLNRSIACSSGDQVRQWAIDGLGIAIKSYWDIAEDLHTGRLVTVLNKYTPNYISKKDNIDTDLYIVYQNRKLLSKKTKEFVTHIENYFSKLVKVSDIKKLNDESFDAVTYVETITEIRNKDL